MYLLAHVVIAGVLAAAPAPDPDPGPPETLQILPRQVDFGSVGHRTRKSFTFTVENRTRSPVVLARVKSSCDCMKVQFDSRTAIGPGETREGTVNVRLGRGFGKFDKYIEFIPADADRLRWKIQVRAQFHPGVRPVDHKSSFKLEGGVGVQLPESRDQLILARTRAIGQPIRVEELRASSPHLKVTTSAPAPDRVRIIVQLAPEHPPGAVRATVTGKVEGLAVEFPVSGQVFQGIRTKPSHFNFSRVQSPADAERKVELISIDGRPFEIEKIEIKTLRGPKVTVEVKPREGGGCILVAKPAEPFPARDRLSGKVIIRTDHPDKPVITVNYFGFIDTTRPR